MIQAPWEHNWNDLTEFFNYPKDIKRAIYATIESLNLPLSKVTRNMSSFPNDNSIYKGDVSGRKTPITPTVAIPLMEKSTSALPQTAQRWSKSRSETSGQSNRMLAAMQRLNVARRGKART